MLTDDAVSSSAAAALNCELPCRESWDRVSEGEWLGDDMSSQFPAQSSSLQTFNLLSFLPPVDLALQLFFNSLQTFLKNPLSYCTLTVLVVFNKESSASNNSWVQPFLLDSAAIVFGTIRSRSFLQKLVTPLRPSIPRHYSSFRLGKPLVWLQNHFVRLSRSNLQPRAAAATSGIRASICSDEQTSLQSWRLPEQFH